MQLRLLNILTALVAVLGLLGRGHCKAPTDAVTVFQRGEGGYYCQKIPYLLLTSSGALIAFAEGRGRNGRSACDDFAVCYPRMRRTINHKMQLLAAAGHRPHLQAQPGRRQVLERPNLALQQFLRHRGQCGGQCGARAGPRHWAHLAALLQEQRAGLRHLLRLTWAAPTHHPLLTNPLWKWVGLGPLQLGNQKCMSLRVICR